MIKKLISVPLALGMCFQGTVCADFLKSAEFTSDLKISIVGEAPDMAGKKASVMIYPSGSDLSALSGVTTPSEFLTIADYYRQLNISDDGSFGCEVLFDDKEMGYRDIKLVVDGVSEVYEKAVYVVTQNDINTFISTLNSWKTQSDADVTYLVLNLPIIAEEESRFAQNESGRSDVAKELVNVRKELYGGSFSSLEEIRAAFNMAQLVFEVGQSSDETEIKDIITFYSALSGPDRQCYMKFYDKCDDEVAASIADADKPDTGEFCEIVGETITLTLVKNVSNHNEIEDILNDLNDFLELDLDGYNALKDKSTVNKGLMKKTGSLKEFKSAFEDLMDDADNPPPKKSQSSGGGGGGIGNVSFEQKDTPAQTTPSKDNTPSSDADSKVYFDDLDGFDWAKESINSLASLGIVSGVGNGKFEPSRLVSREEFVKMIVEAFSEGDETAENPFDDIADDDWCRTYVATAFKKGFVNGVSQSTFGRGTGIKRQDAAVILSRIVGGEASVSADFKDASDISDYAKDAVNLMWELGVIKGNENGEFLPNNSLTRAECAKIINSLLMQIG